jgi:basic membrane lipoprotein Med (substrate-binding protein (PBP1-ABC) superfamily)
MIKQSLICLLASLAAFTATVFGDDLTIGFIYVGPKDDYGYNQAHALGAWWRWLPFTGAPMNR